jgi:PAS domain S-box-containing protein
MSKAETAKAEESLTDYPLEPFFNDTDDLLCIAGFDGYFKKVNPAVSRLLGFSEEELYSRSIKSFIHPQDQENTWKYRENLIKGTGFGRHENRYLTKNGETVWLSWTAIPVEHYDVVYAIAKNITQSKQREKERNSIIADLTNINKELKNITYTTSHDLRTPVSNLMSVFSLLDLNKIQDEETLEFINILQSATNDLKNTLNDYMDLLNQNNSIQSNITKVNLKLLVFEVVDSIKSLIKETNSELKIDIPESVIISFNHGKLKSVVLNLLTNSIKYSHPGKGAFIDIKATENEASVEMIFSDNGIGFDSEKNADRIFELNQQFHDHDDSKGVGLYLVHNHIKSMGGKISVESEINKGATFTILFKK